MELTARVRTCLSEWISFLLLAVPSRSRRTFAELLLACMLSPMGWVTQAISTFVRLAHWTSYYKLIERASWDTAALAQRLVSLIARVFPQKIATLIIDDTLVPRVSKSAPGVNIRHDHSRKPNRPVFLNAQCWVTLAAVLRVRQGSATTVPILSRLVQSDGNTNKLAMARALIESVCGGFARLRVLFDSWYMRRQLILPLRERDIQIVGQVRRDTALFMRPPQRKPGQRGRRRKYGTKLSAEAIGALPAIELELFLYGKPQRVRLRSCVALARFLKGAAVRAAWCEFFDPKKGAWSRPRLLIATETQLAPEAVLRIYAKRWGIEPLFHNLKRWWGIANLWQQSLRALEAWMQLRCLGYALTQMLALTLHDCLPIAQIAPWRTRGVTTAGLFAAWLRLRFTGLRLREAYCPKSQKFSMPEARFDARLQL